MTLVHSSLYQALREANVRPELAEKAAEAKNIACKGPNFDRKLDFFIILVTANTLLVVLTFALVLRLD